tara:strand:- start:7263 stop:7448 length:186 start_codon:yes stop_codon:yes gene_type:complete
MIREQLEEILAALEEAMADADKFDRGNASAGKRLRKVAVEQMKALKQLRAEIMVVIHERKE